MFKGSRHKKTLGDLSERKKYGSVSEDLLTATAKSQKTKGGVDQVIEHEIPYQAAEEEKDFRN